MHPIGGNTASNAGKGLILQVCRRFPPQANTLSTHRQCSPFRLDMSTVAGGWAAQPPVASSSVKKKDQITEGADRSSRETVISPSSRQLGLEAVQRWKHGGLSNAARDGGNRVQGWARLATTKMDRSVPPSFSDHGGAIEGGHTGDGRVPYERNPAGAGKLGRKSQRGEVLSNQTTSWERGRQARPQRARRPGTASRGSAMAQGHGNGDGDRSTTDRAMAMATPAPAATSSQVDQASLMRRLRLAKRRRDSEEARRILEDALAQDDAAEVVDVFVFSATIGVFAKTGDWESAIGVMGVMKEKGVKPNEFTYNQAITACGNGGAWKWAIYLLKAMPRVGVPADVVSYNAAIAACAKGKQSEIAIVLLREMIEASRVAPNALTYSSVMSAVAEGRGALTGSTVSAAAAAHWKCIVGFLEEMREKGIAPDATCYGLAVAACAEGGQIDMAVKLLRHMRRADDITPDLKTYNAVIRACHEAGKWKPAVVLLGEVKEAGGVTPDRVTYTEAIEACWKGGQPDLAAVLSNEMQEAGI